MLPPNLQNVSLTRPEALYLLALPAIVLAWSAINLREARKFLAPVMRALVLALFALALAGPRRVVTTQGATRPVLLDASASITPVMRAWAASLVSDQLKLRDSDPASRFGNAVVSDNVARSLSELQSAPGCAECDPSATNLEAALNVISANPAASGGPAVLVTDGWQNRGDAARALPALLAAGIRLYIFTPPGAAAVPNIAMTELTLPSALTHAAPFALGVTLNNLNSRRAGGTIQIYRNGSLVDQRKVELQPGEQRFDFPARSENAGLDSYEAVFKPDDPALDLYKEDDSLRGWVGIGARRKILILTDTEKDAAELETVVRRMGVEPVVIPADSGEWNGSLTGYDAVVINNVPRERLSPSTQEALVSYVQHGGSLAMTGGDESFGLGGYDGTPLARVLPVAMRPPQHKEHQRALLLIIDKSGSMGRNDKLTYAKAAAQSVTRTLKPNDQLGVLGFDSQPFVVVPLESVSQSQPYFKEMIDRLKPQGRTYLLPALEQAERMLAGSTASLKHVVILTDGETGGVPDQYYNLISTMHRDLGATISIVAIGQEANIALLQAVAKYGGGGFYQTDSPRNLPEIFLTDIRPRGETAMVENEFTPHTAEPNPVLKDYGGRQLPPLLGYVATDLKPGASLDAWIDREGRLDPVIASWRVGAGRSLAVTTDASGRWSGPWIERNVFSPVWNRMLTWMTPEAPTERKLDVALGDQAGRIHLKLTDYGAGPAGGARLVSAIVTRPDGSRSQSPLNEEVPGELSGAFDASAPGTYYIEVKSPDSRSAPYPPLAYTVSPAVNAELPRPNPNYGLLEHLASATGGRLNPSPSDVELTRPTIEHSESLDAYLIVTAMILLIAEALVRRLTI